MDLYKLYVRCLENCHCRWQNMGQPLEGVFLCYEFCIDCKCWYGYTFNIHSLSICSSCRHLPCWGRVGALAPWPVPPQELAFPSEGAELPELRCWWGAGRCCWGWQEGGNPPSRRQVESVVAWLHRLSNRACMAPWAIHPKSCAH